MAVTASPRDLALLAFEKAGVRAGQRYVHYNNGLTYQVVAIGAAKGSVEPTVGYAGPDGFVWFAPLSAFAGRGLKDGTLVPRFALVED